MMIFLAFKPRYSVTHRALGLKRSPLRRNIYTPKTEAHKEAIITVLSGTRTTVGTQNTPLE